MPWELSKIENGEPDNMHKHNKLIKIRFSITFALLFVVFFGSVFLLREDVFIKGGLNKEVITKDMIENIKSDDSKDSLLSNNQYRVVAGVKDWSYSVEDGIPVLLYHGIVKGESSDNINISLEKFKNQMTSLKENSYNSITVKDLELYYRGVKDLPRNPVMITFDDGRRDSVINGTPILKENGFKAVMFINSLKQEEDDDFFLSWEEVNTIKDSGIWEIQSHGRYFHDDIVIDENLNKGHFASNKMWLESEKRVETDEEFENRLRVDHQKESDDLKAYVKDVEIMAFAYPFGDIGTGAINIDGEYAKAVNIKVAKDYYAFSFGENIESGDVDFMHYYGNNPYDIKRLSVSKNWTGNELINVLQNIRLAKID
jgi:peptidoglycan/xylan/chitin deacetylase (PgdA/CDA1 family)